MRINYVYEEYAWGWTAPYNEMVALALADQDVAYINTSDMSEQQAADAVGDAPLCDVWYCMSALDRWLVPIMAHATETDTPVVCHNHGGAETLDLISLVRAPDDTTALPWLSNQPKARVLFNTNGNEAAFCDFYDVRGDNHRVVGVPIKE